MSHFYPQSSALWQRFARYFLSFVALLCVYSSHLYAQDDFTTPQGILEFYQTGRDLPRGVDVNVVDDNLKNALHIALRQAAQSEHQHSVNEFAVWLITQGLNVNFTDKYDKSPLHYAAYYGDLNTVIALVKSGAQVNLGDSGNFLDKLRHARASNKNFRYLPDGTPLYSAVAGNHPDISIYLLQNGARVNATNKKGETALHKAASNGNLEMVRLLITYHSPVSMISNHGDTPLHAAIEGEQPTIELIQTLQNAGASLDVSDSLGKTPLMISVKRGLHHITMYLMDQGADVFAKTKRDKSLLHIATFSSKSQLELIQLLVEKGLNLNQQDAYGWTPLHNAALFGNADVVNYFLTQEINLELANDYGETPLLTSLSRGHQAVDIISIALIEAGANIHQTHRDNYGRLVGVEFYAKKRQEKYPELYVYIQRLLTGA